MKTSGPESELHIKNLIEIELVNACASIIPFIRLKPTVNNLEGLIFERKVLERAGVCRTEVVLSDRPVAASPPVTISMTAPRQTLGEGTIFAGWSVFVLM